MRLAAPRRRARDAPTTTPWRARPARPSVSLHGVADHRRSRPPRLRRRRRRPGPPPATVRRRRDLDGRGAPGRARGGRTAAGRARTWRAAVAASPRTRPLPDALVAVPDGRGGWAVGETPGRGPGPRRAGPGSQLHRGPAPSPSSSRPATGTSPCAPTFVEPAYLEPDASWCAPGGEPVTAPRQRRGLRRQGDVPGGRGGAAPGRRARAGPCGSCTRARTWCATGPSVPPWRRVCGPTAPA